MKFELVKFRDYFSLQKGISYTSANLVEESDTGLLTINAFVAGGGYKPLSEKPFEGEIKADFTLSDGDVLVAMTEQDAGLLASPLVVKIDHTDFNNLTFSLDVAKVESTNGEIVPEFLYNVLRIPAFRIRAAYGDTGSTVQRLPYEALGDCLIPKPSLSVQRSIVRFMDDIDEKIYVNDQLANSLEEIAKVMFKSWFIDFDPVVAKANLEKPLGLDESTADLFPSTFDVVEGTQLPSGFSYERIDVLADVLLGGTPSKKRSDFWDGEIPWINSGEINKFRILEPTRTITSDGLNRSSCKILRPGTTVLAITGATLGQVSRTEISTTANQSVIGISPKSNDFDEYIYLWVKTNIDEITSKATGGAQQHINRNDVCEHRIPIPPANLLSAFHQLVSPLFEEIAVLCFESKTLAAAREALLPKLISGELEIPEILLGASID
jgi:type I restriction enzyme S subunit